MTDGVLAAVERLVEEGAEADDVLRGVLEQLHQHGFDYAAIRFVEEGELVDGPSLGEPRAAATTPVLFEGRPVGELVLSPEAPDLAQRIADLISACVLVGWDTGGERWEP